MVMQVPDLVTNGVSIFCAVLGVILLIVPLFKLTKGYFVYRRKKLQDGMQESFIMYQNCQKRDEM